MAVELSPGANKVYEGKATLFADDVAKGKVSQEIADRDLQVYKRTLEIADRALETGGGEIFNKGVGGILKEAVKNGDIKGANETYADDAKGKTLLHSSSIEAAAVEIVHANYDLAMEQNPAARDTLSKAKNSEKYRSAPKGGYGQAAYLASILKVTNARGMTQPLKAPAKETTMSKEAVNAMAAGRETK